MDDFSQGEIAMTSPLPGEVAEARLNPGGWVYRVAGIFRSSESVPPEAVVGAWKVDDGGSIVGDFIANAKYDALRWPAND